MKQAPGFDGFPFDPFSFFQDGLAASEVDVGRGEVLQALVVAAMVVVLDKWDCSTSRMISSFSDAGYLIRRRPHPRSCFF